MADPIPIIDAPGAAQLAHELTAAGTSVDLHAHEGLEPPPQGPARLAPDLDEFLATDDTAYDWLVPNLLETRDRTILTGPEGGGKSTLLRQLALQVASGIHPFTHEPIPPRRVLLIDCENSARHLRRKLGPLRDAAGDAYRSGHLRIRVAPNGIDLLIAEHRDHFLEVIADNQPELLVIGPIYKMASGDPVKEEPAREVSRVLDWCRHEHNLALLIEAHSPYPTNGQARPQRPYGASLWSRWPEFGIYLGPEGRVGHWRGDRDERAWPARLTRSEPWPWATSDPGDDEWEGPTHCIEAVVTLLREMGDLSTNQVHTHLQERGQGFRKATVGSALNVARDHGDIEQRKEGKRYVWSLRAAAPPTLDIATEDDYF